MRDGAGFGNLKRFPRSQKGVPCREESTDFPGGPAAKTPRFPCRGPGFHPWSGK